MEEPTKESAKLNAPHSNESTPSMREGMEDNSAANPAENPLRAEKLRGIENSLTEAKKQKDHYKGRLIEHLTDVTKRQMRGIDLPEVEAEKEKELKDKIDHYSEEITNLHTERSAL